MNACLAPLPRRVLLTSKICDARRNAGFREWYRILSMAALRTNARCALIVTRLRKVTFRPRCALCSSGVRSARVCAWQTLIEPLDDCACSMHPARVSARRGKPPLPGLVSPALPIHFRCSSGCRLEHVAYELIKPVWYQLYLIGGRDCPLST